MIQIEDCETWKDSKKAPHHRALRCQGVTERKGEQNEKPVIEMPFQVEKRKQILRT